MAEIIENIPENKEIDEINVEIIEETKPTVRKRVASATKTATKRVATGAKKAGGAVKKVVTRKPKQVTPIETDGT